MITFGEYLVQSNSDFVEHHWREKNPASRWRLGQTFFNTLYRLRPDLSERLRGQWDYDPYYRDDLLPAFLVYIEEHWND